MPVLRRSQIMAEAAPASLASAPESFGDTETPLVDTDLRLLGESKILHVVRVPELHRLGMVFAACANPDCRVGWLRLWRSRSTPVFEEGWCCSPACTRAMVEAALRREMGAPAAEPELHRHRVPLGLAMLEQGWITAADLRRAVSAQRKAGHGRLGHWLRHQGVSEGLITRALGVQWSCPVLSPDLHRRGVATAVLPRLFVEAFGALPLRTAAEKILYLGFEVRLDSALALAVGRMSGLRVECGLVEESRFREAHAQALEAQYPDVEMVEAASQAALAGAISDAIERERPVASRLVQVHACIWLRMWLRPQRGAVPAVDAVRDLIALPAWRFEAEQPSNFF